MGGGGEGGGIAHKVGATARDGAHGWVVGLQRQHVFVVAPGTEFGAEDVVGGDIGIRVDIPQGAGRGVVAVEDAAEGHFDVVHVEVEELRVGVVSVVGAVGAVGVHPEREWVAPGDQ